MTLFTNFVTLQNGSVAEWLGRGLQNLVHRFNSGSRLHPVKRYILLTHGPAGGQ